MSMDFMEWMELRCKGCDSPEGDFYEDMKRDQTPIRKPFKKHVSYVQWKSDYVWIKTHLIEIGACRTAVEVFENLWQDYRAEIEGRQSPFTCCVYVLEMSNCTVKIGITGNFKKRKLEIENASGMGVIRHCHSKYIDAKEARDFESYLHGVFEENRAKGEFFNIDFEEARQRLQEKYEINDTD